MYGDVWRYMARRNAEDCTEVTSMVSTCSAVTTTDCDADNFYLGRCFTSQLDFFGQLIDTYDNNKAAELVYLVDQ